MQLELAIDRDPAALDLGRIRARLDQVDQEPRPLEVGEELVAEPDAGARALEQAGHVGDGELAAVVGLDRPEHGLDGRERVVGHLRLGVRDPAQERRLAGVREPEQGRVGDELQPQLEPRLVARLAHLGGLRRAPAGGGVVAVAGPAARRPVATVTRAPGCARSATSSSVSRMRTWVPTGTAELEALAAASGLARPLAVRAPLRPEVRGLAEARQVAQVGVGDQDDVAAVAAVTAVGTALAARTSRAGS